MNLLSKSLVTIAVLLLSFSASATQMKCHGSATHWRDIAYSQGVMSKYMEYRQCIAWTAYQFKLPEELIYAMLDVERGPVNGTCRTNKNGTQDCGPAQINDVRLKELKMFSLSKEDIKRKPCHNIWAMGYLLRREIEKAQGKILPKNTPVLLQSNAQQADGPASYEWLSRVADGDVSTPGSILAGTTVEKTVDANSVLTLGHSDGSGEIGFWLFTGTTIPAYRAYITDFPSGSRGVKISVDDESTTGVADVRDKMSEVRGEYYNMQGCKVTNPTKGLYIVNGRKIIVR